MLAVALACLPTLNWLGGTLAAALRLPAGGNPRLAWDMGWLLASVFAATWLPARLSPLWPRRVAVGLASVLMAAAVWAVWTMGEDFPPWFRAALLVGLPTTAAAAIVASRKNAATASERVW
ncbi:MAG: hypothetical protein K0M70_14385 [Arenimonas sp.]|uniref:hypothetical protein n=1 Tax=Arenimonas sp. TaxID=1872635 RepID=UPI0025C14E18|nr:hypothetical protein [Arenimonas sp.]MBW8369032.1 hypothetical protein [Arenimonas sp.]